MSMLQSGLEYESLRSTIRERGTLRIWAVLAGIGAWGALTLGLVAASDVSGGPSLVPFLVLATTFEISFFVHTGIERIGRYLEVFYEEATESVGWETIVRLYGSRFPGGLDPLFITMFGGAALVNFFSASVVTAGRPGWIAMSFVLHVIFGWRIATAQKLAANQRALDLDRFRKLRTEGSKSNP